MTTASSQNLKDSLFFKAWVSSSLLIHPLQLLLCVEICELVYVNALGSGNNQDLTAKDIEGDGNVSDIVINFYGFKKIQHLTYFVIY